MTAVLPEKPAVMTNALADLPDMAATADPILLPGLLRGLGLTERAPESDFEQSLRLGLTEGFAAYDARITEAAS